jgi:hypothetical protein
MELQSIVSEIALVRIEVTAFEELNCTPNSKLTRLIAREALLLFSRRESFKS